MVFCTGEEGEVIDRARWGGGGWVSTTINCLKVTKVAQILVESQLNLIVQLVCVCM